MTRHPSPKPLVSYLLGCSLRALYLLHFVPWHFSLLTSRVSANSVIYLQSLLASELSSWAPVASWEHQEIVTFMPSTWFHSRYLPRVCFGPVPGSTVGEIGEWRDRAQPSNFSILCESDRNNLRSEVCPPEECLFFLTSISEVNHLHKLYISLRRLLFSPQSERFWNSSFRIVILWVNSS